MNDSYRATVDHAVELRTLGGGPVTAQLAELRIEPAGELLEVDADFELHPDQYDRCLTEGQLGLDAPGRGLGPEPEPDHPVTVVARLRPYLAAALAEHDDPMKALLEQLLVEPAELAHADAWRALDVTQTPPEQPEVRLGYRTGWYRG